ncbi:fructose-bisphosphatase class I [Paracoccus sp. DMF]|uniref:fructose-bisphosphatase class I n=1 Tax=Paracoccus sp. DMF TaxID=400837 RepID=UPI0021E39EC3|nr:fructose-bisphosphatase class I [Paracoccus sp. DMF]MCV2447830.1 fructose-bisphosphatase class I [Paracoccus sp. DMF]
MTAESMESAEIPAQLRPAMQALASGSVALAGLIRRAATDPRAPARLEREAAAAFTRALPDAGLRWLDMGNGPAGLDPQGGFALALTPLDASANIGIELATGTLFSLHAAADTATESLLRPPAEQLAAGYVIHGPRCMMMVSFGDGVQHYLLDPDTRVFRLVNRRLRMPKCAFEFAIDVAHYRHWPRPVRAYIDDCLAGSDGPRKKNFAMRWLASLVAEAHRILMHGGVFLQPGGDARNAASRLRLVHDCAPIALLIEAAGGSATDLCEPVLGLRPAGLDQRIPFAFGSTEKVARIAAYHDLPEPEVSALFGHRGLFRA